jgi:hypothetical protein
MVSFTFEQEIPFSSTKVLPSMHNNTKQYGFFINYYPSKSCLLSCDVNSGVHNDLSMARGERGG